MTAEEYAATPEDAEHHIELQEGALLVAARPVPDHQDIMLELAVQLRPQVPEHLKLLVEVDIDLCLVPPADPGTIRSPDLVVVTKEAFLRVRKRGGLLRASDTVLAIEIHSASTRRTDTMIKRNEYADAGINHYWMIDPFNGPSLTACHLAGDLGYGGPGPVRGTFTTQTPFPTHLDLDTLG